VGKTSHHFNANILSYVIQDFYGIFFFTNHKLLHLCCSDMKQFVPITV